MLNNGHALNNSRLINGCENSWCCFRKTALSTWQSVKQVLWRASFVTITFTSRYGGCLSERTLEQEEGYNHDKFTVSLHKLFYFVFKNQCGNKMVYKTANASQRVRSSLVPSPKKYPGDQSRIC